MSSLIRTKRTFTTVLCVLLVLAACTNRRPSHVLPPEELESILFDYHLVQSMISDMPASERYQKDLYFDYIYDKHHVTAAEVDSSLVYYARNPKELSAIYVNLSERVERTIQRVEQEGLVVNLRVPKAVVGDSADLWYESPLIQMSPSYIANRFTTSVPYDTNFKSNDSFVWSGDVFFVHPEPDSLYRYLHLSLVVEYDNDSIASVDTMLYTSGTYCLSLADTIGTKLRNISSGAYYKGTNGEDDVLLYNTHLMRYRFVAPLDSLMSDSALVGNVLTDSIAIEATKVDTLKPSKRVKKLKVKQ